jgi:cytidyltransferase-like protein
MEVFSDDDFDIVSNPGQRSLESSIADLDHIPKQEVHEPAPAQAAIDRFDTVSLTAADIQTYVRKALDSASGRSVAYPTEHRTVRVYVDGTFDMFNTAHALQLRQAKLAFPSVYLTVGIFSDELCQAYQNQNLPKISHAERCEVVRHCRWVDEIISDAPWVVDDQFILQQKFDYIALAEGMSVDPACDKFRLGGYDALKKIGRVIPTRRTSGVTNPMALILPSPQTPLAKVPVLSEEDVNKQVDRYGIGFG